MAQKCETISYWSPTPYREPRLRSSKLPSFWRFTNMQLKPYPKPQDKELHRESVIDGSRGLHVSQQGVLRKEWAIRQACGLTGKNTANRCPLSLISTNTLQCNSNNIPTRVNGSLKGRPASITFTSSLVLSPSTDLENDGALGISREDDLDGSFDIWDAIKPGNTKEKIAIFASQICSSICGSVIYNAFESTAISPESRSFSVKNKGSWDGDCSVPKRRRRSGNVEKPQTVDSPSLKAETHKVLEHLEENIATCQDLAQVSIRTEGEDEKSLSVVEIVANFEQRANDEHVRSKPPSLRSTKTITLSRSVTQSEDQSIQDTVQSQDQEEEEEAESVRVLDMVAKLESQCPNRHGFGEIRGDLSRNNSLRRKVGRVLLAGSEPFSLQPHPHPVSPTISLDYEVESVLHELDSDSVKLSSFADAFETQENELNFFKEKESSCITQKETSKAVATEDNLVPSQRDVILDLSEEPLPGMLFFPKSSLQPLTEQHFPSPKGNPQNKGPSLICDPPLSFRAESQTFVETVETCVVHHEPVPFPLRRIVSREFLETRFKIQLLLEPPQYMAALPHHIILKIFHLLPTQSLVALKCTCHYFKFIIEHYCIRPADSRWVSDPRYKDDPCMRCKKRYDPGDISLCRWHHKRYCQVIPYGPGYWMCCRRPHKDSPGCNVGLHDNRWVPSVLQNPHANSGTSLNVPEH